MSRLFAVTACVFSVVSACPAIAAAQSGPKSGDEAKIKALEAKFDKAFNAGDLDAMMSVYAPDVHVFDVITPREYVGAVAYRKDFKEYLALFKDGVKFTLSDLKITVSGNMAYSHSIQQTAGTTPKGETIAWTVRVTDVYRKHAGKWLIVHEHVSVPVDPATGKPDMTSKP